MPLFALIPLLLLLFQPVSTLANTPDDDHMEKLKTGGVCLEDTGPVRISLYDQGESGNKDPNLACDEGDEGGKAVTCKPVPFSNCSRGENSELFNSARFDQVDG